jgi:hypothetical protein
MGCETRKRPLSAERRAPSGQRRGLGKLERIRKAFISFRSKSLIREVEMFRTSKRTPSN